VEKDCVLPRRNSGSKSREKIWVWHLGIGEWEYGRGYKIKLENSLYIFPDAIILKDLIIYIIKESTFIQKVISGDCITFRKEFLY
jgi:hypothetical protein